MCLWDSSFGRRRQRINLRIAELILASIGHSVELASGTDQALACLAHRSCDAVLMDLSNARDGRLRADPPHSPRRSRRRRSASRLSRSPPTPCRTTVPKILDTGMDDYVAKPIRMAELVAALQRKVSSRRPRPYPRRSPRRSTRESWPRHTSQPGADGPSAARTGAKLPGSAASAARLDRGRLAPPEFCRTGRSRARWPELPLRSAPPRFATMRSSLSRPLASTTKAPLNGTGANSAPPRPPSGLQRSSISCLPDPAALRPGAIPNGIAKNLDRRSGVERDLRARLLCPGVCQRHQLSMGSTTRSGSLEFDSATAGGDNRLSMAQPPVAGIVGGGIGGGGGGRPAPDRRRRHGVRASRGAEGGRQASYTSPTAAG